MKPSTILKPTPEVMNAILRKDLYSFTRAMFPLVSTSGSFLPNWHIQAMAFALDQVRRGVIPRLLITVPPRYLKSILASVAFPAYLLGHDPTARIICVSYSDQLARSHANDCRAVLGSGRYREIFPATIISTRKDTEVEVKTTRRGYRFATSVGGTLTGRGGNFLIIDDPQKPEDAYSELSREKVERWYYTTLYPRLDNKQDDAIIIVMQRLHVDDLVGKLLPQPGWHHLNFSAIAEIDEIIPLGPGRNHHRLRGDVLHPERESLASLEQTRRGMGTMDFAAQYQQSPVPEKGNLIHWDWFNYYDTPPHKEPKDEIIVSWDTALSAKDLSSYSVGIVMQVRGDDIYVLDVVRDQLEYPELRRRVIEVDNRWKYACNHYALVIENKGSGMSLIQDLKHEHKIRAIAIDPVGDKIMRMASQTAKIEAGHVFLPRNAPWLGEFQKEVLAFPRGHADDQVDALSQGLAYVSDRRSRVRGGHGAIKGFY